MSKNSGALGGGQQVEVDGAGQVIRILGEKVSQPGNNITLTLDLDVQRAAEKALGDRKGAIVALDPRNGAVLAMVSRPAFNPNWFAKRITQAQWQELQRREFPFVNRAMQAFPPASTFKIITATAGMESGKFSPGAVLMTYPALYAGASPFMIGIMLALGRWVSLEPWPGVVIPFLARLV